MADFLSRLAERTLEVTPVAQPITTSLFAKRQTMTGRPSESERFPEQDEASATPRPATRWPSPRTPRATPAGNPPSQAPASPGQPLAPVPEGQVPAQPEPPRSAEAELPPASGENNLLVGPDRERREERHYEASRQYTSTKKPGGPSANVSPGASWITGQPLDDVENRVQNTHQAPPNAIARQETAGRVQHVDPPRAMEPLVRHHEGLSTPIEDPAARTLLHDSTSVADVEKVQRAWPDERPRGDTVAGHAERQSERQRLPGSDSAPQRNTGFRKRDTSLTGRQALLVPVVQQQEEFSNRQQVEPLLPDEFSGSPAVRSFPPPASPPHNQGGTPARRSPELTAERAATVPTIRVTIGRIDVRAVTPPEPPPRPKPVRSGPTLSLDEYSRQRKGGGR